ncbi:MAG TPA: hypothetical protein VFH95_00780 [Candidatus Kapabacteria bacterium]|nr:hypothetical protein [Candidatus Kapabacteria bacterium]
MIDFKELEMADIEVVSGPANSAVDRAFSKFLKDRAHEDAEMRKLRRAWDDLQVVPGTPEDAKAFSKFLKARNAKQARAKATRRSGLRTRTASTRKKTT